MSRPALALPFTILGAPDQVRLVAGEDFRITLAGPGLEAWLPGWLSRLDGSLTLEQALALLPESQRDMASQLVERLSAERVLVAGPVEMAHPARTHRIVAEGTGPLRDAVGAMPPGDGPAVTILCQDRLDFGEALAFNERCLRSSQPWLWASCAALARGHVSPVFLPDAGPCLACLLGHFRRRSPLPELYDELILHTREGKDISPSPFPPDGVAVLARLAAWKAALLARPEAPAAVYRLHVLEAASLEVSSHAVLIDPECTACGGRR